MSCRNLDLLASVILLLASIAHADRLTPKPQESFAPYWTTEPGWDTELQLRNNLAAGALTVTPVLRLANGKEIPLDPVTISCNASAAVLLSEALLKHAPILLNQPGTFGSVAFRYTARHARNLRAVLPFTCTDSPSATTLTPGPLRATAARAAWKAFGGRLVPE